MDINELISKIQFGDWNNDELNQMARAIIYNRKRLTHNKSQELQVGMMVQFKNRNGTWSQGKVVKIKLKNANVVVNNCVFNVPMSMLEAL